METDIKQLLQKVTFYHGQAAQLHRTKARLKRELKEQKLYLSEVSSLRLILSRSIEIAQEALRKTVESLVTASIRSTFNQPYEFKLEFSQRSDGRLECIPYVYVNGVERNPKGDMGGSLIDVISTTMRIVLWKLDPNEIQPIFFLDEPMTSLGLDTELDNFLQFLVTLENKFNLQIVITTHTPEIAKIADKWYHLESKDGKAIATLKEDYGTRRSEIDTTD